MDNKIKQMMWLMVISSIIMIASIFSMNWRILGFGLLQWIIVFGVCFSKTPMIKNLGAMSAYNDTVMVEAWKQRKYFKATIYGMSMPFAACGIAFVILAIGTIIIIG